jgi:hypothetical protein
MDRPAAASPRRSRPPPGRRNGRLPERTIVTGVGAIAVEQPRVHDRRPAGEREVFHSQILPPYLRKTKSLKELIPWLYLKGISTGGFQEALQALVGLDCPGLSATTITRLKRRGGRPTPGRRDQRRSGAGARPPGGRQPVSRWNRTISARTAGRNGSVASTTASLTRRTGGVSRARERPLRRPETVARAWKTVTGINSLETAQRNIRLRMAICSLNVFRASPPERA